MSTLKIDSKKELLNILRSYKIYVDGKFIGKVSNGKTQSFDIEPGKHSVYAKLDFFKSNKIDIQTVENEEFSIKLKGSDFALGITTFYTFVFLFFIITRSIFKINVETKFPLFIFFKDGILKIEANNQITKVN